MDSEIEHYAEETESIKNAVFELASKISEPELVGVVHDLVQRIATQQAVMKKILARLYENARSGANLVREVDDGIQCSPLHVKE